MRFLALFLIPCLLADPALVSAAVAAPRTSAPVTVRTDLFNTEALSGASIGAQFLRTFNRPLQVAVILGIFSRMGVLSVYGQPVRGSQISQEAVEPPAVRLAATQAPAPPANRQVGSNIVIRGPAREVIINVILKEMTGRLSPPGYNPATSVFHLELPLRGIADLSPFIGMQIYFRKGTVKPGKVAIWLRKEKLGREEDFVFDTEAQVGPLAASSEMVQYPFYPEPPTFRPNLTKAEEWDRVAKVDMVLVIEVERGPGLQMDRVELVPKNGTLVPSSATRPMTAPVPSDPSRHTPIGIGSPQNRWTAGNPLLGQNMPGAQRGGRVHLLNAPPGRAVRKNLDAQNHPARGVISKETSNDTVLNEFLNAMKSAGYSTAEEMIQAAIAGRAESGSDAVGYPIPRMPGYGLRLPHQSERTAHPVQLKPWPQPLFKGIEVGQPIVLVDGYRSSTGGQVSVVLWQEGLPSGTPPRLDPARRKAIHEAHLERIAGFPLSAYVQLAHDIVELNRQGGELDRGSPGNLRIDSRRKRFAMIDLGRGKPRSSGPNTIEDLTILLLDHHEALGHYEAPADRVLQWRKQILANITEAAEKTGLPMPEDDIIMAEAYASAGVHPSEWFKTRQRGVRGATVGPAALAAPIRPVLSDPRGPDGPINPSRRRMLAWVAASAAAVAGADRMSGAQTQEPTRKVDRLPFDAGRDPASIEPFIRQMVEWSKTFNSEAFEMEANKPMRLRNHGSPDLSLIAYGNAYINFYKGLRQMIVAEMKARGDLTNEQAQEFMDAPSGHTVEGSNPEVLLNDVFFKQVAMPFFARYGLFFFDSAAMQSFTDVGRRLPVPAITVRPVISSKRQQVSLHAYGVETEAEVIILGPSRIADPFGVATVMGQVPPTNSNQILIMQDSLFETARVYGTFVDGRRSLISRLAKGDRLSAQDVPDPLDRLFQNLLLVALWEKYGEALASKPPSEIQQIIYQYLLDDTICHETIHYWDNRHGLRYMGPLGETAKEIRAHVGSVIGHPFAGLAASILFSMAWSTAHTGGGQAAHGDDYFWITGRLLYYAWLKTMAHMPSRSDQQNAVEFGKLPADVREQTFEQAAHFSDQEWQELYQKVWLELNPTMKPEDFVKPSRRWPLIGGVSGLIALGGFAWVVKRFLLRKSAGSRSRRIRAPRRVSIWLWAALLPIRLFTRGNNLWDQAETAQSRPQPHSWALGQAA